MKIITRIEANQQSDGSWTVFVDGNQAASGLTLEQVDERFGNPEKQ